MVDWKAESKNIGEKVEYWSPTPGRYTVNFLDDGEEYSFEWEGQTKHRVRFKVDVNDGKKSEMALLGVTKSRSDVSFFGQLVKYAAVNDGIKGATLHIIVQGKGKERRYTVEESLNLVQGGGQDVENEPLMS